MFMIYNAAFRDLEKNQNKYNASKPDPTDIVLKKSNHPCVFLIKL